MASLPKSLSQGFVPPGGFYQMTTTTTTRQKHSTLRPRLRKAKAVVKTLRWRNQFEMSFSNLWIKLNEVQNVMYIFKDQVVHLHHSTVSRL